MFKFFLTLSLISISCVKNCLSIEQPAYQVSIWLRTLKTNSSSQLNENVKHLCNGAIIHERLIITTAFCLLNQTDKTKPIDSNMLYIEAGNGNRILRQNISKVEVDGGFNHTTLQNDIAILYINGSLKLAQRNDIKWITLDDHYDYKKCRIQIYNPLLKDKNSPVQSHDVPILLNKNCTNTTIFKSPRTDDICSTYILDSEYCNSTNVDNINVGTDGGTGLVCDSKLIALLSQIVPNENRKNCTTKAIYTKLTQHLNWFYEKIAVESVKDIGNPNHDMGTPYDASSPAHTITEMTTRNPSETLDTNATITNKEATTTTTSQSPVVAKNAIKSNTKNNGNKLTKLNFTILSSSIFFIFIKFY